MIFKTEFPYDELRRLYARTIMTSDDREYKKILFGKCLVDVPAVNLGKLLVSEILNPFYIFQVFAIILWSFDGYRGYAACILIVSSGSVIASLWENITNGKKIRQMARYSCPVQVRLPDSLSSIIESA